MREEREDCLKTVGLASAEDRAAIYRLRHDVFATELGQHMPNETGLLFDRLDDVNTYIVIKRGSELCGHISLTPPTAGSYSIEKYLPLSQLPFVVDDRTFEARLLTVRKDHRGAGDAVLLMYGAYSFVRDRGGSQIIAMGRKEVLPLYERSGFVRCGVAIRSGAVDYEVMSATIAQIADAVERSREPLDRALQNTQWNLKADA